MSIELHYHHGGFAFLEKTQFRSQENLEKSREILQEICKNFDESPSNSLSWYISYRLIYEKICWPYIKYKPLFEELSSVHKVRLLKHDKEIDLILYLFCISNNIKYHNKQYVLSEVKECANAGVGILLTYLGNLRFREKPSVALWSSYNFHGDTPYDFRIAPIYEEMYLRNIKFVRIVRLNESFKKALRLFRYSRERLIFSGSIIAWSLLLNRLWLRLFRRFRAEKSFISTVVKYFNEVNSTAHARSINKLTKIFAREKLKSALVMEPSERGLVELISLKELGVKTVACMNGVDTKYFHVHKFCEYTQRKDLALFSPDRFGVWSPWWADYFEENSNVIKTDVIRVSGHLRPPKLSVVNSYSTVLTSPNIKRILIVHEPHLDAAEWKELFLGLGNEPGLEICFKLRIGSINHDQLLNQARISGICVKEENIFRGDIYDAIAQTDLLIASHSTALLDAASANSPFLVYKSKKFGDYLDIESDTELSKLLFTNYRVFQKRIMLYPLHSLNKFRQRYLSSPEATAAHWICSELEEDQ